MQCEVVRFRCQSLPSLFLARLPDGGSLLTAAAHAAAAQEQLFRTYSGQCGFSFAIFPSNGPFDQAKTATDISRGPPCRERACATIIIQVDRREKAEGQTAARS